MLNDEIKELRVKFITGCLQMRRLEEGIREYINQRYKLDYADIRSIHGATGELLRITERVIVLEKSIDALEKFL
jgi:hypothetical protein